MTIESIQGKAPHGRLYWCVKTDLSPQGEIFVVAERVEVTAAGALVASGGDAAEGTAATANLICAPGRWSAAYLASPVDGAGLAVHGWLSEGSPAAGERATLSEAGAASRATGAE